jgi:hypothetical protein
MCPHRQQNQWLPRKTITKYVPVCFKHSRQSMPSHLRWRLESLGLLGFITAVWAEINHFSTPFFNIDEKRWLGRVHVAGSVIVLA